MRRVVYTTGNDNFARSSSGTRLSRKSGAGHRAGLVQVLTVEELDTGGAGRVLRLVKDNLGDMGVYADIEGVLLGAISVLGIADLDNEFTRTVAVGVIGRNRDLVVARVGVTALRVGVSVTEQQSANVYDSVGKVSEGKGTTSEYTQQLGILQDNAKGGFLNRQPAVVAMALLCGERVSIVLKLFKVLAHVGGGLRVITSDLLDVFKV